MRWLLNTALFLLVIVVGILVFGAEVTGRCVLAAFLVVGLFEIADAWRKSK